MSISDINIFKDMVANARIEYDETVNDIKSETTLFFEYGYYGFVSQITFNSDGDLIAIESYE